MDCAVDTVFPAINSHLVNIELQKKLCFGHAYLDATGSDIFGVRARIRGWKQLLDTFPILLNDPPCARCLHRI